MPPTTQALNFPVLAGLADVLIATDEISPLSQFQRPEEDLSRLESAVSAVSEALTPVNSDRLQQEWREFKRLVADEAYRGHLLSRLCEHSGRPPDRCVTKKGTWGMIWSPLPRGPSDRFVVAKRNDASLFLRRKIIEMEAEKQTFPILWNLEEVGLLQMRVEESSVTLQDIRIQQRKNQGIASALVKWLALYAAARGYLFVIEEIRSPWMHRIVETEEIFEGPVEKESILTGVTLRGRPRR